MEIELIAANTQNRINMSSDWQTVMLKKASPFVYPRFLKRINHTPSKPSGYFFIEQPHSHYEFIFEQIDNDCWLAGVEIKGKFNNRYVLKSKETMSYYSINILSTNDRVGYRKKEGIRWGNENIWFMMPGAELELYLEKGATVKCCRLIFKEDYLCRLMGVSCRHLVGLVDGEQVRCNDCNQFIRNASKAELFLQLRILNILKCDRQEHYYKASLLSNIFELITLIIQQPLQERNNDKNVKNITHPMAKAAQILEQHVFSKFPGITSLAGSCKMSPTKLKKDFKLVHGLTTLEYFRSMQILSVKGLLNGREKTVKELAVSLGLKKHSDFSEWYRKIMESEIDKGK